LFLVHIKDGDGAGNEDNTFLVRIDIPRQLAR
jgi:hypothetical protein